MENSYLIKQLDDLLATHDSEKLGFKVHMLLAIVALILKDMPSIRGYDAGKSD